MKLINIKFIITLVFLSFCGCSSFIEIQNSKFISHKKPYYFIGTNLWYGCYLGREGEKNGKERLIRELNRLSSIGITNLRVLGASEESDIKNSLKPAFQKSKGVYNNELLEGLDFLLAEMKKRNMHAVIFLNNYWEWSGGMLQYLAWANNTKPDDPSSGIEWNELMTKVSEFYSNNEANKLYRDYIKMLINRKNVYTGKIYKDDNTIMSWELANEPRCGEGKTNQVKKEIFCKWVDETADFIHSLDKNHLVTTGSEGTIGCKGDYDLYKKSHSSKNVDYLTFHLWPNNWDWFKPDSAEGTFQPSVEKSIDYINNHIQIARQLKKPLVLEEFGFRRDSLKYSDKSTVSLRDKFFDIILNLITDSIAQNAPVSGVNFWGWSGEGRPGHQGCVWQPGDDFVIEPPFESQGINSIYDSDSGTIEILKKYVKKLNEKAE